jgi:hypothetical protein
MGDAGGDDENITPTPAVTYRLVTAEDIGNAELKFYKKKADALEPEDPHTPVDDAATVTADNMTEYVVENAAGAGVDSTVQAMPNDMENNGKFTSEQQDQITDATKNTLKVLNIPINYNAEQPGGKGKGQGGGGRRRSKRRHPKKGSRKSKKSGARKSKKVGRSRKNDSKRRAHRKH